MNKENINNSILFFLIGLIIGLSTQFFFSLWGFCVFNQNLVSYLLAIGSIAISFFIYLVSTKQTDNIENQTQEIKEQTKELKKVSNDIYGLNIELNTAILGQAKGFEELFKKIHDILVIVNNHESTMRLVLPIPTLGFFNKNVRSLYETYKKVLVEICKSNKSIELLFLNPLTNSANNKVLLFFKSIIGLPDIDGIKYETIYKKNVNELINFLIEIALACGWNKNVKINFIDDIFLSGIIASNGGYKSSLFFFIGPELLKTTTQSNINKQDYVSTGVYNNTSESYALINNLIDIQKSKTNTIDLFEVISPDLFCCLMKQISKKIENEEGDSITRADLIFDEFSMLFNNLSIQYFKIEKSHFYVKNNGKKKNILILPSAAGIYSHFNMGKNHNSPRFNMYYDLITRVDFNCYLLSFSGQGLVDNGGEFSVRKGKTDLRYLSNFLQDKGIKIDLILNFCVSNQIYFDFCNAYPKDPLSNLPLIIWDLPSYVNWKDSEWFRRTFKHIKPNLDDFYNTTEPIESLPEKYDNRILYCFPQVPYNDRDYSQIKEKLNTVTQDFSTFEFQNLKHIPNAQDDINEYNSFINLINKLS